MKNTQETPDDIPSFYDFCIIIPGVVALLMILPHMCG